jgi:hypothetical protein
MAITGAGQYWSPEPAVAAQLRTVRRRTMKTISLKDAVALIPDAASLMIGGFMAVGQSRRSGSGRVTTVITLLGGLAACPYNRK